MIPLRKCATAATRTGATAAATADATATDNPTAVDNSSRWKPAFFTIREFHLFPDSNAGVYEHATPSNHHKWPGYTGIQA